MFGKLTQFWVSKRVVWKMILEDNVRRVTASWGLLFILTNHLSLSVILLALVRLAINLINVLPILVFKIHLDLLLYVWHWCKRWVTTITFSAVDEVWAPHHDDRDELDILVLVIYIHNLHESAVGFRLVVCENVTLGFSLNREILGIFLL